MGELSEFEFGVRIPKLSHSASFIKGCVCVYLCIPLYIYVCECVCT